jgi:hypothetical protein
MSVLRIIPITGTEIEREAAAASILPNELTTTNDQRRLFLQNYLVGSVWHPGVTSQADMLNLWLNDARGCWPGDLCQRTDSSEIYGCMTNNGQQLADWILITPQLLASLVAYTAPTGSTLTANNLQDAVDQLDSRHASDVAVSLIASEDLGSSSLIAIDNVGAVPASAGDITRPAKGFVTSAVGHGASSLVRMIGILDGLAGLSIGAIYLLSTVPGQVTTDPNQSGSLLCQVIGTAISNHSVLVNIQPPIFRAP